MKRRKHQVHVQNYNDDYINVGPYEYSNESPESRESRLGHSRSSLEGNRQKSAGSRKSQRNNAVEGQY